MKSCRKLSTPAERPPLAEDCLRQIVLKLERNAVLVVMPCPPQRLREGNAVIAQYDPINRQDDFEQMKDTEGKDIKNARNLAAGSIRLLDPSVCKGRYVYFYAFNIKRLREGNAVIAQYDPINRQVFDIGNRP